ncbi:hypothetical protein GCM10022409_26510 [Hymenobacter glaciei]|uniref:Lipoprotein n=1 Tax=Hymenobacter glaciei TaxID=877209 RepID=A0ABP7UBT2_9BACT
MGALTLLLTGCHSSTEEERRREFIKRHYAEDFRLFRNTLIASRGKDDGNWVYLLFCPGQVNAKKGNDLMAVVRVSVATDSITSIRDSEQTEQCTPALDSVAIVRLMRRFLRYPVNSIGSDAYGNISFGFGSGELGSADITRVEDSTRFDATFWQTHARVQGPWYERKVED